MTRAAWLIGSVAAFVIASKLLVENVLGITPGPEFERWLTRAGTETGLAVVTLLAVDLFLPVPSSLVMVLSGAAFGVLWGSVLSLVGSIGGEWLGFELVRKYGKRASRRIVGDEEIARLEHFFARHGAAAVVVSRALPVLMETMSVVAGLSTMRRSTFLWTSLVGTAPIVVIYAYAGAVSREAGSIVPGVVILVAMTAGAWIWYRARRADIPEGTPNT